MAGEDRESVRRLGDIVVTAVSDGYVDCPIGVVRVGDEAGEAALAELSPGGDLLYPHVNAYLVESGGRLALIDAGAGTHMGPRAGKLLENLAALGVAPARIDAVVLTHCHPDHILGIADEAGNAIFGNAELVIPLEDQRFWMESDPATIENPFLRHEMERAQKAAAAYRDKWRTVAADAEALPGVTRVPLPGHSPGHSGYMIEGGGDALFVWADIVHLPTFQPGWPDASLLFDFDQDQARATRRRTFDWVLVDQLELGGGHLLAPGFARLERTASAYRIVPSTEG